MIRYNTFPPLEYYSPTLASILLSNLPRKENVKPNVDFCYQVDKV